MTHYALFPTALGACGVAWRGDAVIATRLPYADAAEMHRRLAARTGATAAEPPPVIRRAVAAMTALLAGEPADLRAVTCDLAGVEPFAAEVYAAARAIPAGATATYGEIAARLGGRHLARAVGRALGRNPVPLIVPCHRVMGAGGKLTGFSGPGGVRTKLRLLAIEGARTGAAPTLFDDVPPSAGPRG